jgi:two-component system alkaline phosphatase synthesis response regulator PhoP
MPTVLIVDDDPTIHHILMGMLEKLGYQCITALNGQDGAALALEHHPDLVLLDIMMPEQDGYETCQQIRGQGYQGAISMISALQEATGTKKGQEYGANGYLIKPIDPALLELHLEYAATGMDYPTVKQWLATRP